MSDHFSGPRAIAGPAGDICDLYAFPSPERSGRLVLVLDVLPQASLDSHFSEAIVCRFRLRPVTIAGVGTDAAFPFAGEDQELVFSCNFEAPRQGGAGMASVQDGWCVTPSGETVRFRVHDEQGGVSDGVRVYALELTHSSSTSRPLMSRKRPGSLHSRRLGPIVRSVHRDR